MKKIIQFKIFKGEDHYVGEGVDLPIVTQGKTIDETVKNLREALQLYLENEDLSELDIDSHSTPVVNFELPQNV